MTLNEFLNKLINVKKIGSGYICKCPAHDDNKNSLSVSYKDEKIILYCHAGCRTENILSELGLKMSDLFNNIKQTAKRVVEEYIYKDENEKILYKTIRYDPKGFSQARPDGNGGWIYNLNGVDTKKYFILSGKHSNNYTLPEIRISTRHI